MSRGIKNKRLRRVKSVAMILLGNFIYACAVRFFLMTANLATGGVTGISIALGQITPVSVSAYALVLNVIMWILGLFLLGRHFAAATLLSTFSYPVFLGILEKYTVGYVLTEDRLLCTVFGGILIGAGIGITMREDASTGGIDVIPLALNKYFKLPVSVLMYAIDVVILLAQVMVFPPESLLYGIMNIIIYSIILDKVLLFGQSKIEIKIISEKYDEIAGMIIREMDRGVTLIDGEGGYLHRSTKMVYSIVTHRELNRVEKRVHEIDASALVTVSKTSEVSGRGFTLEKEYQ